MTGVQTGFSSDCSSVSVFADQVVYVFRFNLEVICFCCCTVSFHSTLFYLLGLFKISAF